MSRMIWVPDAVHRYYLQEVKRRSAVMRSKPVNPSMPDGTLVSAYRDLLGKDSDELIEMIDPTFKQLAQVEQLNKTLATDELLDTGVEDGGKAKVTGKEQETEDILKDLQQTGIAVVPSDYFSIESVQFPDEIVEEVTINTNAEVKPAQSSKRMEVLSEEDVDMTFDILDEIIAGDMQDDCEINAREVNEGVEKKNPDMTKFQNRYIVENTLPDSDVQNEFTFQFEISEQSIQELLQLADMQEDLMKQEVIEEDLMKQEVIEEDLMKQEVIEEDLMKQEVIEEDLMKQEVIEEDLMKQEVIEEDLMKQEVIEEDLMKQEVIEEDLMKQEVIEEDLMKQEVIEEDLMKQEVIEEDLMKQEAIEEDLMQQEAIDEDLMLQELMLQEPMDEIVVVDEPVQHPAPVVAPRAAPVAPPKRINRRKQKHVLTQQTMHNREIELIHDDASNKVLLGARSSLHPKVRHIKTYERKRKQEGPSTDSRPDKQPGEQ